ncbi:MAG TPA: OB-fold domain-containing protein [Mycobacteriales bacterium]|nr:OB-fold domain-containing protein [Mycobacteriales bacterium]
MQRCERCGWWRWPPQLCCPRCLSEQYSWAKPSGSATVYSYTVIHRPPAPHRHRVPYLLAIVRLDEGPHLLTNLEEIAPEDVAVGLAVRVQVRVGADGTASYPFVPAAVG